MPLEALQTLEGPDTDYLWTLNFGPQHPATHTTLRLVLTLDGETVIKAVPDIGFLHSGFEKLGEDLDFNQYVTIVDRMNYISPIMNEIAWHHTVEKLMGIELTPRCKYIRTILGELARISDHLLATGAQALDLGAFTAFLYAFYQRMDLLRWLRFLWAVEVSWDRATRVEARDFCRWLSVVGRSGRPRRDGQPTAGRPASMGRPYAASVQVHSETVLRSFYDFHRDTGRGPILNPFPLDRSRRAGRANAHHSPMERYRNERAGLYRPRVPARIPRSITDEEFNEIFARLPSHRDRALVAFYVSTGARASELLSTVQGGVDPGRQLISVIRKGSREVQELPASTDAFVWLRLYQVEMEGLIPKGRRQPLWWTRRRPVRPLTYHAVHRMFERVNQQARTSATLHALRHTAAYRMAEDPALPLTDVQLVLGHAQLTTTQTYLTPRKEDVIRRVLAHHDEQTRQAAERRSPVPAPGYRPETLDVLFGRDAR